MSFLHRVTLSASVADVDSAAELLSADHVADQKEAALPLPRPPAMTGTLEDGASPLLSAILDAHQGVLGDTSALLLWEVGIRRCFLTHHHQRTHTIFEIAVFNGDTRMKHGRFTDRRSAADFAIEEMSVAKEMS